MAELTSVQSAVANVQAAIEVGELVAQRAPYGHPIFAALERGREVLAWLENEAVFMQSGVGPRVQQLAQQAIDGIYDANVTVRNDPNQPLSATIWPKVKALPWPWIGAGAAALVVVAILFQRRGRA